MIGAGRCVRAALLLAGLALPMNAQDTLLIPNFVEESQAAGVNHAYRGEWQYMVGGGVAAFDCDGDLMPDLLMAGGEAPAAFYRNVSVPGGPLKFESRRSGLELDAVTGAYPLDVDSDGLVDLVLLRVGENVVLRGLGDCRFARANEAWGFDGGDAWSTAFAATWERGATWPTLAIGNYIDRHEETFPWGTCTDNWLHRPEGAGFAAPQPLTPSYCALSMLFTDWNRSGTPALRVSNDREYYKGGQEQLWRVEPGRLPELYGPVDGWKPLKIWGMGIASEDLNHDGFPEYYLTSMADNKLQTLAEIPVEGAPAPVFRDVAFPRNVHAQRPYLGGEIKPSTAWHAQFGDVNNDGLADLFVAKGNVAAMPDFAMRDPNNLLLQQPDGVFLEAGESAGVASFAQARGGMLADFNMDGLLDLVVVNRNAPAEIWRNVSRGAGHWLQLRLSQTGANRDAVGAWIEVRIGDRLISREITSGGGHASGHLGWWHFGLGTADAAEVRVLWPDGAAGPWETLAADEFQIVTRDAGATAFDLPP
jgi:enediyne biosynthesis protein E4